MIRSGHMAIKLTRSLSEKLFKNPKEIKLIIICHTLSHSLSWSLHVPELSAILHSLHHQTELAQHLAQNDFSLKV